MSNPLPRFLQMGLIARDLASLRLRSDATARQQVRERLVERLGLVHGLPQKIGQIMAFTDPGDEPAVFQSLTEKASSLDPEKALAILLDALHPLGVHRLQDAFQDISLRSISASIGQVHCAVLQDGRKVAVKVQHPGIKEHVESDLKALGWLTGPIGSLRKGFDLGSYRREIGEMLAGELDFAREARNIKQFAARTQTWPGLRIPQVVDALSADEILTMTWIEGQRLDRAATWSQEDRDALGSTLLRLFLHGMIPWGFVHADPNPGNYRFLQIDGVPTVGLLDFGCVKAVPTPMRHGFALLARMAGDGSLAEEELFQCHLAMGFAEMQLAPLKGKLVEVNRVLFQPFADDRPFDLEQWHLGSRLTKILGEHRMAYRTAGPPDLVFALRAFHGVIHQLRALRARINWKETLENTGEQLNQPPPPRSRASHDAAHSKMKSDTLHIRVSEAGKTKVSLVFSAAATDNLADLVPLDLKPRLEARGICLRTLSEKARATDYAPAELFSMDEGDRNIRVWLEA
jgi:predicted unusual protein kinase regulating ubiquinone biosynthesis (AarF/ABC1/UbiB family)